MNIIVLGDKFQKRMKSKGCVGLIKINNKSIIQLQHKIIKHLFPESKIVYVYGFEGKRLHTFLTKNTLLNNDIMAVYNSHYEKYNNAYSLSLIADFLDDDCLILFGDTIISKKTFAKFNTNNGSQVFLSKKNKNRLGCIINDGKIENISYDLDNYLSEIYYLTKEDMLTIKHLLNNKINSNYFIFEIINKLIDMDKPIYPFFSEHSSITLVPNKA